MLIRSIEAYVEKDMNKAQEVIRHDDIVDDLFDKNKADIIELIRHDPEKGEQAADMLMVAKYFERIGDHATNIAEWVIFALNDKKEIKEEEYNEFVNNAKEASFYDTGKDAEYGDQLMTLSTCSYHTEDGRFAVVARKK